MFSEALLLHWSNIVGATHTDDYRIWEYDGYASRGVKEVCEFGYSSSVETDMKKNVSTNVLLTHKRVRRERGILKFGRARCDNIVWASFVSTVPK